MNPTNEVRMKFQEYMRLKGKHLEELWTGTRYFNKNIQTKWLYFLAGWTMKGK
jgi:hypothetical protein